MKQLIKEKTIRLWPFLIVIKYVYSICITFLAFQTVQNAFYLVVGLTELVAIIFISNSLLKLNKAIGHIVHFSSLLLYNIQMLILCFAGSFVTNVMLTNIGFLHDLHGKFGEYLTLIIPMIICTFIPAKKLAMKKKTAILFIVCAIVLETVTLMNVGNMYSPIYNVYQLYASQQDYNKMISLKNATSVDAADFYQEGIEDGVKKPGMLENTPNVVLIFAEGMSEHLISDKRNIVPNIRKIESESLRFTNYYNHTFATLRGLIGQLYSGYQLANLDSNELTSMQSILKDKGYYTSFVNTEPTNKDFTDYLESMRFDELVTDMETVDHKAAYIHDKDAFDLLFDTIEKQNAYGKPFFTAMYTFGTHVSLDSPDEKYADGSNALLNKFYNMDYQFGRFLEKFKESELYENTILVFTTDHAIYADEDFALTFHGYDRVHTELDEIPLFIYHKGIQAKEIDAGGRNSLCVASTVLDYMDISEGNYFLGKSLFIPKGDEFIYDTTFYDSYYSLSTNFDQIKPLDEEQYSDFTEMLAKYFSVKDQSNSDIKMNVDYVTAIVSEDCSSMTITMKNESGQRYKNIWFPVWSDIDNQDDLEWYRATQNADGDWCYTVDLSRHNSKGSYSIHVYEGEKEPEHYIGAAAAYVSDYVLRPLPGEVLD